MHDAWNHNTYGRKIIDPETFEVDRDVPMPLTSLEGIALFLLTRISKQLRRQLKGVNKTDAISFLAKLQMHCVPSSPRQFAIICKPKYAHCTYRPTKPEPCTSNDSSADSSMLLRMPLPFMTSKLSTSFWTDLGRVKVPSINVTTLSWLYSGSNAA